MHIPSIIIIKVPNSLNLLSPSLPWYWILATPFMCFYHDFRVSDIQRSLFWLSWEIIFIISCRCKFLVGDQYCVIRIFKGYIMFTSYIQQYNIPEDLRDPGFLFLKKVKLSIPRILSSSWIACIFHFCFNYCWPFTLFITVCFWSTIIIV